MTRGEFGLECRRPFSIRATQGGQLACLYAMRLTSYFLLCLFSVGVAFYALIAYGSQPLGSMVHPDMRTVFEANRVGIYLHIFGSALALIVGPFQFSKRLRTKSLALHRVLGAIYLLPGVLVGGLSGLYMAFHAYGGPVSKCGFGLLAVIWLYSGSRAYLAIRAKDIPSHRRWMIRNFALTFGAVTLRVYLPSSFALDLDFDVAYPAIAWLAWVPNLAVAEWLFNRGGGQAAADGARSAAGSH